MTDILLIVFVSISVFMASLFSTVTGFGFALVAVPFLMPVLGAHETVVFIIFGTCLVKMIVLWNTRKHFEWHTVAVTVAGSVLGSLPGSYLLNAISPAYLQILLGTVLVIVLFMMGMHFDLSVKNKTVGRITAGFLSGFSAATTSISGPPVALYFLTEGRDKTVTRAQYVLDFCLRQYWYHVFTSSFGQQHQRRFNAAGGLCYSAYAFGHMDWRTLFL